MMNNQNLGSSNEVLKAFRKGYRKGYVKGAIGATLAWFAIGTVKLAMMKTGTIDEEENDDNTDVFDEKIVDVEED